jgi:hypothetical protein
MVLHCRFVKINMHKSYDTLHCTNSALLLTIRMLLQLLGHVNDISHMCYVWLIMYNL